MSLHRFVPAAVCSLACLSAFAEDPSPPGETLPRPAEPAPESPPMSEWKWEGAIGPVVSSTPQYSGSSTRKVSWTPGYYLRWGRVSITNASGFQTRRYKDDVFRGLSLDLKRSDVVRFNVALRIDNGRKSSDASGLQGIEDVRRTLRARLSATYQIGPGLKTVAGLNSDLLGRGGGNIVDLGVNYDHPLTPFTSWGLGAALTAADARYMKSWYGVNAAESTASGHPVYLPHAGGRDVTVGTNWRTQIDEHWVALYGGSASRLVGPAAASPLTTARRQWSLNGGLAWSFW